MAAKPSEDAAARCRRAVQPKFLFVYKTKPNRKAVDEGKIRPDMTTADAKKRLLEEMRSKIALMLSVRSINWMSS
jgi:hypothetical protein